jgi:hypothetical protein
LQPAAFVLAGRATFVPHRTVNPGPERTTTVTITAPMSWPCPARQRKQIERMCLTRMRSRPPALPRRLRRLGHEDGSRPGRPSPRAQASAEALAFPYGVGAWTGPRPRSAVERGAAKGVLTTCQRDRTGRPVPDHQHPASPDSLLRPAKTAPPSTSGPPLPRTSKPVRAVALPCCPRRRGDRLSLSPERRRACMAGEHKSRPWSALGPRGNGNAGPRRA